MHMKVFRSLLPLACALTLCALPSIVTAQAADTTKKEKYVSSKFWASEVPFELTLVANLKQINNDKGDPGPLEDPAHLDARRAAFGMSSFE